MKKHLLFIVLLIFLSGCASNNVDKIDATKNKIVNTEKQLAKNTDEKMAEIAVLASGTDYSLKKVTNPPVEVKTAIDINGRVINIAGNPNLDELNKIKQLVDLLNSEMDKERKRGEKLLSEKDSQIIDLQQERVEIQNQYEDQINTLKVQATEVAKKADKLQVVVNEVNSWMGLGGVVYGMKRFVSTAVIGILIFGVLFIALRFFATVNPIAGAIFSVFEHFASYAISLIKGIFPNSLSFSNHIELPIFNRYKNTLDNVVDTLYELQKLQKKSGTVYKLDDVFVELDKNLNDPDKKLIDELKSINKYGA
jgi:hypothetical protein